MRKGNNIKLALNLFGRISLASGAGVEHKQRQRLLEFVDSINIQFPSRTPAGPTPIASGWLRAWR